MAIDEKKLIDADKLIEDLIPILQCLDNAFIGGRIIMVIARQPKLDVPNTNVGSMDREFEELEVTYPPDDVCTYPEYRGKPYFAIKYKENGEHFVGYGTYKPEVLSRYLRDYFMPSAMTKESKWIPCSERLPEENGSYIVTSMDYVDTFEAVFEAGEWFSIDYCDDIKNVIAWMPLPEPYKEDE